MANFLQENKPTYTDKLFKLYKGIIKAKRKRLNI